MKFCSNCASAVVERVPPGGYVLVEVVPAEHAAAHAKEAG